ncbi:MAG: 50S ribosomal protein L25 [Candidatus Omnitrophota bacterium]|nr:50S ribosomal protein L25 [Candidatus Omnitrophota bacterium]
MEKVILKAQTRSGVGKRIAKDLRNKGIIPANVYKLGKDAVSLQISAKDLGDVLHTKAGENVIITLTISGTEGSPKDKTVLIKEIQREPIKYGILHVDFNEISLTEALKVNVPLSLRGEPVGVKIGGGILEHVMWEVQVECLPTDIPEKIDLDVTNLKIGEAVYVKDIIVPAGVKVLTDPELIALIVKPPKVEVPKEEAAPEAAAEPELIRKKKEEAAAEEGEALSKAAEKPAKEAK